MLLLYVGQRSKKMKEKKDSKVFLLFVRSFLFVFVLFVCYAIFHKRFWNNFTTNLRSGDKDKKETDDLREKFFDFVTFCTERETSARPI